MEEEFQKAANKKISADFLSADVKDYLFLIGSLLLRRFKRDISIGVLYLKTIVGSTFKNRFTTATGSATVRPQILGSVRIARNPTGYESL